MYFNVFCDFVDTPRWTNTPAPPVGSYAFVAAVFAYVDNDTFCHFNILELNFVCDKSTVSSAPKKTASTGNAPKPSSPCKRKNASMDDDTPRTAPPRRRAHHPQQTTDVANVVFKSLLPN